MDRIVARAKAEFSSPKISSFLGSLRNVWTALIPLNVSTKCTITSAMVSLVRR